MDLTGKVAVVTGGGRGLGLAYARALADAGAAVVVNDADGAAATAAVAMITGAGGNAVAEVGAVGSTEVADRLVRRAIDEFGGLDTVVTNAGILRDRVLWKMTDDDFDQVVAVHLRGTFTCVRAAVRHLRDQGRGGRVVVVGSPAGQRGNFGQTNYSAAKAAIVGMVRTWAQECAKAEITVNAVVPVAATAMTRTIPAFADLVTAFEERGEAFPDRVRKGAGFGTPDDAAGLVVFLASDAAAGITGQVIGIGGDKLSVWSHPSEIAVAYAESGWSSDAIAATWASFLGHHAQTYGVS